MRWSRYSNHSKSKVFEKLKIE